MLSVKSRIDKIKQKHRKSRRKALIMAPVDKILLTIILFLTVIGILAVFSAGAPEGAKFYDNAAYYFIKHFTFIVIGLVLMFMTSRIDYKKWRKHTIDISIVVAALILATKVPGLGKTSYGASRWLTFLPIQPSELGKLACILLVSDAIASAKTVLDKKVLKTLMFAGFMILTVLLQPNLSIASLMAVTCAVIMLVGGVSFSLLASSLVFLLPVLAVKVSHTTYQANRITGWLNPWADQQGTGYNLIQSWYAIASGGLIGVGYGCSKMKEFWLPFGHTDFIFSVISEEFGFIGSVIVLGLFIAFLHRGFLISHRAPDQYSKLVAFGITFIIGLQAFINIAVTTGVMPVTGVTLPLISYGGTSVIITLVMMGLLLNISRKRIERLHSNEREY